MPSKWLSALKEEESKHNTAAALRESQNSHRTRPHEKSKTPINATDKTDKTIRENLSTLITRPDKTDKTPEADALGLAASWSGEFGFISIHDPTTGEWWDLHWKDAPEWSRWEAKKRKQLYKGGNRRAHRLTSQEMARIWEAENRSSREEGIVEEHPVEGEG